VRSRKVKMIVYSILFAVGSLALAVAVMFSYLSATSHRPANLGVTDGKLLKCPASPNCVCSQDDDPGHNIEPFRYSGKDPIPTLASVIGAMTGGKVISSTDDYLYAEFTSLIFRFVDDVEFQVDPAAKVIQCRSASRAGHSDLGVNRKRIEAIRKAFAEREGKPVS
jgi:uncharacterized protein (DUF1499 family)